ncbi:glycosyltransferase [Alphaproteobacteria bacterium]|nr:glycosyltransferase [Alphaproteobacteria bacterium]
MKKILITTVTLEYGGAERVAVNLANQLALRKYDVRLLVLKSNGPLEKQVFSGVKLVYLHIKSLKFGLLRYYRYLNKYSPDIVISNMRNVNVIIGIFTKFLNFESIIFREATTFTSLQTLNSLKRWLYLRFFSYTYSSASTIISNSDYTAKELVQLKIAPFEKITVIGNPVIDRMKFLKEREQTIEHKWLSNEKLEVLLYSGRLHKVKNLHNLIYAFQIVNATRPNLRLILLGDGEEKSLLIDIITKNNLQEIVDIIPFSENPLPFYKNCDAFVLPSKWEGFGNVLVEAISCGAPVIVNNCPGGAVELAKKSLLHKITNSNDIKQFALDIEQFLREINGRRQPKSVCDYFIENFDTNFITERYIDAIM